MIEETDKKEEIKDKIKKDEAKSFYDSDIVCTNFNRKNPMFYDSENKKLYY